MRRVELLVVGGGPAGQAAAATAARHGVDTLLVDEGPVPLDWMTRQVPRWYGERLPVSERIDEARGRYLAARPGLHAARELGVDVRIGHACWGLFDGLVAGIYDGAAVWSVQAQQLILATGSSDVPLAFQGRTLPGVLGALGALDLLETRGSLGGERVVVLGAGNLGLEVARRARAAGHEIVAIAEIDTQLSGDAGLLRELEAAGTEVIPGYTIAYARGTEMLEQVLLTGVDRDGRRVAGQSYPLRADTLVVAIGRAPAIELPCLLGCAMRFDAPLGGYVPAHSATMETSVPGVYVAGDAAGASDAGFPRPEVAEQQGRIAATAAAVALGKLPQTTLQTACDSAIETARAAQTTADGHLARWHQAAMRLAPDAVVVCRCEGITLRDILDAVEIVGDVVPDELKRITRAGMGVCQGRGCRAILAGLLAERHGTTLAALPLGSYRPPLRPVPMRALAEAEVVEEPLLPQFAVLDAQLEADAAAGLLTSARLAAARYKIREENHLALVNGLSVEDVTHVVRELRETVRHVTVH